MPNNNGATDQFDIELLFFSRTEAEEFIQAARKTNDYPGVVRIAPDFDSDTETEVFGCTVTVKGAQKEVALFASVQDELGAIDVHTANDEREEELLDVLALAARYHGQVL